MSGVIAQFGSGFNEVGTNDTGNIRAQRQISDIASRGTGHVDIGAIARGGAQLATNVLNAQKASEANNAKGDWVRVSTSEGYLNADAVGKAEMLEGVYEGLGDRDEAYQNAFMGYSSGEYARQYNARGVIEDNAHYNAAGASQMAWMQEDSSVEDPTQDYSDPESPIQYISNEAAGKTPKDFVDIYTKANPRLDKVVVSRALMSEAYVEMISAVNTAAPTETALANAIADVEDIKAPYKTPMFLSTKQKQGQEYVNAMEGNLSNTIKAKNAEIKQGHYTNLANATEGGNRVPPSMVEQSIDATASNPLAAEKQKQEYNKKYVERTEADVYNSTYLPGNRPGGIPTNKTAAKERQLIVTKSLVNSFNKGSMGEFVRVAVNETGQTKQAGAYFMSSFNRANTDGDVQLLLGKFNSIDAHPQGAMVLRQMLTDAEYTRIKSIEFASQARPNEDMKIVKDWVDGNMASIAKIKLDPSKNAKMLEYATKLGTQAQAYISVMGEMLKANPQLAEDKFKEIALTFEKQVGEDSTGMKHDTSMSTNPADGIDVIDTEHTNNKVNSILPEGTTNKVYLGGENKVVVAKDAYNGTIEIINTKDVIDEANTETEIRLLKENEELREGIKTTHLVGGKIALKSFGRTLLDNAGAFAVGTPDVLGTLVGNMSSRFVDHMANSMSDGQQEFFGVGKYADPEKEEASSELLYSELEKAKKSLTTELPGVQNITMSAQDQALLQQGIFKNKATSKTIDNIQSNLKSGGITGFDRATFKEEGEVLGKNGKHIEYKSVEGGNNTIGRGHKITDAEKKSGKINDISYKDGLTEEEANAIYIADKKRLTKDLGTENLSSEANFLLADVAHRAGNIKNWKFTAAIKKGDLDEAFAQLGDLSFKDAKGNTRFYNERNMRIFKRIGYTPTPYARDKYNKLQQAKLSKG